MNFENMSNRPQKNDPTTLISVGPAGGAGAGSAAANASAAVAALCLVFAAATASSTGPAASAACTADASAWAGTSATFASTPTFVSSASAFLSSFLISDVDAAADLSSRSAVLRSAGSAASWSLSFFMVSEVVSPAGDSAGSSAVVPWSLVPVSEAPSVSLPAGAGRLLVACGRVLLVVVLGLRLRLVLVRIWFLPSRIRRLRRCPASGARRRAVVGDREARPRHHRHRHAGGNDTCTQPQQEPVSHAAPIPTSANRNLSSLTEGGFTQNA